MASSTSMRSARGRSASDPEALTDPERGDREPVIRLELYGLFVLAFAVALLLSLVSFAPADVASGHARGKVGNILGPVGANVADLFLGVLGIGAFALVIVFGWLGVTYLIGRKARMHKIDILGALAGLTAFAVLAHIAGNPGKVLGHAAGGAIGMWIGEVSSSLVSIAGTVLVFAVVAIASVVILSRRSVFDLAAAMGRGGKRTAIWVGRALRHGDGGARSREEDVYDDGYEEADEAAAEPIISRAPSLGDAASEAKTVEPKVAKPVRKAPPVPPVRVVAPAPVVAAAHAADDDGAELEDGADLDDGEAGEDGDEVELDGELDAETWDASSDEEVEAVESDEDDSGEIKIVESAAMRRTRELLPENLSAEQLALPVGGAPEKEPYVLPALSMLEYRPPETQSYDRELLKRNAQVLESKLADYKIKGKVVEIHPGPVITMYEFMPAPGVKVSAIAGLASDLAMALSAISIRIVAPIPGKNVVGIEIPNAARETVWLKEILSDGGYARAKSRLTLALGKDIVGNPQCMDLGKAPHLLVAGATGAGKSVAINSFVCSLLYKADPADVRVIMVDPKMLELSIYEGIPHLLLPVVTDPKQAATALKWAVKEMERRYRLMADTGVRNLAGYNQKVEQLHADPTQRLPEKLRLARLKREARGEVDAPGVILDSDGRPVERLPSIVVIIDELADLMMVASKEVEHCIARLAQMARASGIHLIVATQRPSVDVITGLIKANFPTRISFRVASQIDSRTILDQKGAEALLGMGDMLYLFPGQGLQRVHGCYVSEEEVHRVVAHLKTQGTPDYDMGILVSDDDDDKGEPAEREGSGDELYDQAVRIAAEARQVSTSYLQRKLKIGYNRAARIVEKMEEDGIVGPSDGTSRPREVFIDPI